MQSNFKRADNNPANWRPGELGINTEIGKISVDNYAHKSFTIGRKPAGNETKRWECKNQETNCEIYWPRR